MHQHQLGWRRKLLSMAACWCSLQQQQQLLRLATAMAGAALRIRAPLSLPLSPAMPHPAVRSCGPWLSTQHVAAYCGCVSSARIHPHA